MHFLKPSSHNRGKLQEDRLWSLLAAGSASQSEKEITWSDGNGNTVWEEVSSRLRVRDPDPDDNTNIIPESALHKSSNLAKVNIVTFTGSKDLLLFSPCYGN